MMIKVKIKMILKLDERKMVFKRRDHIERQIKMIVAVTVIRVVTEKPEVNDVVNRQGRTVIDQRTGIVRGIDHVIEIEGIDEFIYFL